MAQKLLLVISLAVFVTSLVLGFHNATLYQPNHGFDGIDHVYYIEYIVKNHALPPSGTTGETHQSPLYYLLGAAVVSVSGTVKTAQYLNTFVLWAIIGMAGLGLWKVFHNIYQVLIGMFSLAALPMLNIFPAMVTNELLNTFWVISCLVASIFLLDSRDKQNLLRSLIWFTLSFILGIWTKASIVIVLPVFFFTVGYLVQQKRFNFWRIATLTTIFCCLMAVSVVPVSLRENRPIGGPSNIVGYFQKEPERKPLDFYYRLDWIPKIDMYNTQYYSLLGGAWDSFWTDGQNAITPFVSFHKKSLVLWILGFILFPLSLFGLYRLYRTSKIHGLFITSFGLLMFLVYLYFNYVLNHYSAVRLTYVMGIVLPYAMGIAAAAKTKKIATLLVLLISVQFITMVSFYWILPWWHVTR